MLRLLAPLRLLTLLLALRRVRDYPGGTGLRLLRRLDPLPLKAPTSRLISGTLKTRMAQDIQHGRGLIGSLILDSLHYLRVE